MQQKMVIGVVGFGFVGKAVVAGFENDKNRVVIADPLLNSTTQDVLAANPKVIFVCVPTPMGDNGVADTSIVESVFAELKDYTGIVALKSTVIPSVIEKLETIHEHFVYNPEFLTEVNAVQDFLNPFMHVFGGKAEDTATLAKIYKENSNCTSTVHHYVKPKEAAMIKYGINSFLASKVLFMNQWYDLCETLGIDYEAVASGMGTDPRITKSHMKVPGPDGRRFFASACFSKDVPAIIRESMTLNSELSMLRTVWNLNCDGRNQYPDLLPREKEQHITFNKI